MMVEAHALPLYVDVQAHVETESPVKVHGNLELSVELKI